MKRDETTLRELTLKHKRNKHQRSTPKERFTSTIARNYTSLSTTRCKCPATFLGSRTLPLPASEQRNLPSPDEGPRQCSNRIYLESVWSFTVIVFPFPARRMSQIGLKFHCNVPVQRICLKSVWSFTVIVFPFPARRMSQIGLKFHCNVPVQRICLKSVWSFTVIVFPFPARRMSQIGLKFHCNVPVQRICLKSVWSFM